MLYGFVDVKWSGKLLKVLFLFRIFEVNKYLIIFILFFNFIIRGVRKGLVVGIIIMDHLGIINDDKARL